MRGSDIVHVIENEHASYSHPWNERIFLDCLRVGYRAWVAEDAQDAIVGHALASIAVGEAHVLNLCVGEAARGQGVAGQLLETLIAQATHERAYLLFLEVRRSNKTARRLYVRYGFEQIATRPGYYPAADGREDALLLSLDLAP